MMSRQKLRVQRRQMRHFTHRDVEIETVDSLFGPAGIADETYVHDIAATFDISDRYRIYGGVNNIGDERPFITEFAFPVNPIGRFFFVGLEANIL